MPSRHLLNALSIFKIITYDKLFLNNPSYLASDEKGEYEIIILTDILEITVNLSAYFLDSSLLVIFFSSLIVSLAVIKPIKDLPILLMSCFNLCLYDKATVIQELRHKYKVVELIRLAGIARSTYYYYLKIVKKPDKYADVKDIIKQIYHENKGRITLELRNRGFIINHKTVQRLMKQLHLKSIVRIKKYKSYRGEVGKIAPNILKRNFKAEKPNEKWVTDVTEFSLFGKKLYLSPILDLYNGEIVSYNISDSPNFAQITNMLEKAFLKLPDNTNLLLHSDQGWQYQMKHYRAMLNKKGIVQSMSRKGNCLDNSVMENFFGLLKSELLYLQEFDSLEHFKKELKEYIDYYNNKRIKCKLKGMSPVQYRIHSLSVA